jgi:cytochrome c553
MTTFIPRLSLTLSLAAIGLSSVRAADDAAAAPGLEQVKFFETHVRPVLAGRCLKCHGEDKQESGLRLDSRDGLLAGGENGPAVVPGRPEESLLVEAINHASLEMPPDGKLADEEIAALSRWVEIGAPWPADVGRLIRGARAITEEDRRHWAYQPLREPVPPEVADGEWTHNEIDRFIFEKLAAQGLSPAPEADRVTLTRRVYQDVIGLPPSPEQVDAFLSDESPDAWERLVDSLLDSPRHGEHWARFWLDLVRYAESDGYKADGYRPHAWQYRDYVIGSFNTDKPYDRFVLEQLAGDEIAPEDPDALAATGYFRHVIYEYNQRDAMGQWRDMLTDLTDNVADTFLAMGMGCARCHDHKFDPILQRDYYRLQGFLTNVWFRDDLPLASAAEIAAHFEQEAAWRTAAKDVLAKIAEFDAKKSQAAERAAVAKFAPEIKVIWAKPAAERTAFEKQIAHLVWLQVLGPEGQGAAKLKKEDAEKWEALQQELSQFDSLKPAPLPAGHVVTDIAATASAVFIPGKERLGEVEPGVPTLFDPAPAVIEPVPTAPESTGRRTALARWLTRPDHPLTARVIVNRIWQQHFGAGLVATPSDFGHLGEPPSHPELLDWLATRFISEGWSLKWLHRTILTSATFRQASLRAAPDVAKRIDPANRLLWRFPIHRLTAEQIRDAMLAVSGELSLEAGGPGVEADVPRRSVYTKVLRNARDPLLDVFDLPDRILGTGERNVTTTPGQSLLLINGEWGLARSAAFARRLQREIAGSDDSKVRHAYRLAYARDPSAAELERGVEFLQNALAGEGAANTPDRNLVDLCHVLLNSSEFLYVD